jgi:3-methyladenine DNA glycosylase AlkC
MTGMGYEQFKGRFIPPQKLGKELETSEFTIHRWIREGKIKAVKLSSRCTRVELPPKFRLPRVT